MKVKPLLTRATERRGLSFSLPLPQSPILSIPLSLPVFLSPHSSFVSPSLLPRVSLCLPFSSLPSLFLPSSSPQPVSLSHLPCLPSLCALFTFHIEELSCGKLCLSDFLHLVSQSLVVASFPVSESYSFVWMHYIFRGFPGGSAGEESARAAGVPGLIPGSGRPLEKG